MLPALSTFISGVVNDSFKKIVQPAGLINASIFVLLNLALILPILARLHVTIVRAFFTLPDLWQILILIILILVMGFTMVSLSTAILSLMSGELWAETYIGCVLIKLQARHLEKLRARIPPSNNSNSAEGEDGTTQEVKEPQDSNSLLATISGAEISRAEVTAAIDFPSHDLKGMLAPTKLGNVLNAMSSHIWQHYRIDIVTLWPPMEIVIAEEKTLPDRIQDDKASFDFLLILSFVLYVFTIEYALVNVWDKRGWSSIGFAMVFGGLGYIAYRAAIAKARTWSDGIRMAFDLYRGKLREKLGLPEPKSRQEEFLMWGQASRWLQWDKVTIDPFLPQAPATPEPQVLSYTASDNVKVDIRSVDNDVQTPNVEEATAIQIETYTDYLILLEGLAPSGKDDTKKDEKELQARGVYIIVSDPRIASINESLALLNSSDWPDGIVHGHVIPAGNDSAYAHNVIWSIQEMAPGGAGVLHYHLLKSLRFHATSNIPKLFISGVILNEFGYQLKLTNRGANMVQEVSLTVHDSHQERATSLSGQLANATDGNGTAPVTKDLHELGSPEQGLHGDHIWKLSDLDLGPGDSVLLVCGVTAI